MGWDAQNTDGVWWYVVNIQLVPRVCKGLADQANCEKVVELCGVDSNLDLCTAKLVAKGIFNPEPMVVVKSLYGFGKDTYHATMQGGHDYLHTFAKDLIQNIGGDGKIGVVGSFIAKVIGG